MKNDRKRTYLLITIPILALFITFNTIPLLRGVVYSFTNFRGFGNYEWVGLRNYIDLFSDARVGSSYIFTIKLAVVTTIVVNVISIILALALNSKIRAKSAQKAFSVERISFLMYLGHWLLVIFLTTFLHTLFQH